MPVSELAAPLLEQELFQGLSPLQITEIARRAEKIIYRPGQVLIEQGEIGDAAILVVSGEVARIAGPDEAEADELIEPGSLIGEMAMLVDREHTSTFVARSSVKGLRITRETLFEQMHDDPRLAEHIADKIGSRLNGLLRQLKAIEAALQDVSTANEDLPDTSDRVQSQSGGFTPTLHH
ncbi:MAG: hypothetical protein RLZ98_3142 [Pseudomonadota bacterium]|jgi:CRP-like cAMP-binding protein